MSGESQLGLFDEVEFQEVEREYQGNEIYVRREGDSFVMYFDADCTDYFSKCKISPTAERVFSQQRLPVTFLDGTFLEYRIRKVGGKKHQ